MKGLELSEKYFEECGRAVLAREFPGLMPYIAVAFVGPGSDRYGFDDELSTDHDFEPGFCIFLPGEELVSRQEEFRLERAYAKLPKEFMGFSRQRLSAVGGSRNGVIRTAEFYRNAVGAEDGVLTVNAWLHIPDYALAEAVNGRVFMDNYGEFTRIRESIKNMPEDIRLKRLAGNLLIMAQSGQYNYTRCLKHGEYEAAALCCSEYVRAAMKVIFLLRKEYMPYYKWSFRALRQLEGHELYSSSLSSLLSGNIKSDEECRAKYLTIEKISSDIIAELLAAGLVKNDRGQRQNMSAGRNLQFPDTKLNENISRDLGSCAYYEDPESCAYRGDLESCAYYEDPESCAYCGDLESCAYCVNDMIADGDIRNLNIFEAV